MNKIAFALATFAAIAFIAFHSIHANDIPSVVYVDDDFNEMTEGWNETCFATIQAAIDAVAANGTIYVYGGTYYENIIVNKTCLLYTSPSPRD